MKPCMRCVAKSRVGEHCASTHLVEEPGTGDPSPQPDPALSGGGSVRVKRRCWLADQHLPSDEELVVQALLRQLDFHRQELRITTPRWDEPRLGQRRSGG